MEAVHRGGHRLWEDLVDAAVLQVCRHLAARRTPLAADGAVAAHMRALLSRDAIADVAAERCSNGHCAMVGCANPPRGSSSGGDGGGAAAAAAAALRLLPEASGGADGRDADADADLSWEDDVGFRLWQRQRRTRRLELRLARQRHAPFTATAAGGAAPDDDDGGGGGCCSAECYARLLALLDGAQRCLVYGQPEVLRAVGCLFPNLRLDVLHRLAGAEAAAVPDVVERPPPPPVGTAATAQQPPPPRVRPPPPPPRVRPLLPPTLAVLDFFQSISTPRTYRWAVAALPRVAPIGGSEAPPRGSCEAVLHDLAAAAARATSPFARVAVGVLAAHQAAARAEVACGGDAPGAAVATSCTTADGLRVDPVQHSDRRRAFVAQVLAPARLADLSALLLYDLPTLHAGMDQHVLALHAAASAGGEQQPQGAGILTTLVFPFAMPLVRQEDHLLAALALLLVVGLVSATARAEWLNHDNGLQDVLAAVGATEDDLVAIVTGLLHLPAPARCSRA